MTHSYGSDIKVAIIRLKKNFYSVVRKEIICLSHRKFFIYQHDEEVEKIPDFVLFKIFKKIAQVKLDFIVAIDVLLEFN